MSDPTAYAERDEQFTDRDLLVRIDANTERLVEIADRGVTALEADHKRKDRAAKARQKLLATVASGVMQRWVIAPLAAALAIAIVSYAIAGTGLTAKVTDYFEIGPAAEATGDAGAGLDSDTQPAPKDN